MSYPTDILLPGNAKYLGFVDSKNTLNPHWDIVWSFVFALSGTQEHGFTTFITTNSELSGYPGHYLGYSGSAKLSSYLSTEDDEYILTESGERLLIESETGTDYNGMLCIAFDSTGLFALSSNTRSGVGLGSILKNSLIIRDDSDNIVLYEQLSNINTGFVFSSAGKYYQTLRIRYSNSGSKLSIDYKQEDDTTYQVLTSIPLTIDVSNYPSSYVGFSYCSPISSLNSPSTIFVKNFHVQGNMKDATYDTCEFIPITADIPSSYNTLTDTPIT